MVNVERLKKLLLAPKQEWPVIAADPMTIAQLYRTQIVPLSLIGPLCLWIRLSLIGYSLPFGGEIRVPIFSGLMRALVQVALTVAGVYVWAQIVDALAPKFNAEKNPVQALKVAAYAATPSLLAGILQLMPSLAILSLLAAFYGLYLLYLALPVLMKAPDDKAGNYTIVVVVAGIVVALVIGAVVSQLTPGAAFTVGVTPN